MLLFSFFLQSRALKIVRLSRLNQKEFDRAYLEEHLLIKQHHPYIVECYDIFEGLFSNSQCLMIVLEYCPVNLKLNTFKIKMPSAQNVNF